VGYRRGPAPADPQCSPRGSSRRSRRSWIASGRVTEAPLPREAIGRDRRRSRTTVCGAGSWSWKLSAQRTVLARPGSRVRISFTALRELQDTLRKGSEEVAAVRLVLAPRFLERPVRSVVQQFVHLQHAQRVQLLDWLSRVSDLVARAKDLGMAGPRAHRPRRAVRRDRLLRRRQQRREADHRRETTSRGTAVRSRPAYRRSRQAVPSRALRRTSPATRNLVRS